MFDDLGGRAGEGISAANVSCVEGLDGSFCRAADAATEPGPSQCGRVAVNFVTGPFILGYLLSIIGDTRPLDLPPVG